MGNPFRRPYTRTLSFLLLLFITVGAFNTKNSVMSTAKKQKMNNDDNCDDGPSSLTSIRAGFIGCGTIASAIATSLATPDHKTHLSKAGYSLQSISVTRRSESKSSKLKENFEDVVTVYESAEEVVLHSNLIFLCVLPQQVDAVLEELTMKGVWKSDHTLVSLVVRVCVSFDLTGYWYVVCGGLTCATYSLF